MTRLARRPGTFLPTPSQHHLLRAALVTDREAAADALARWTASTALDNVDLASARLAPLLYRNLERLGIAHPYAPRLKGLYRRFWYHNELLLDAARDAICSLASAGMPVVLLKGAAIAVSLCEHALRPMQDVDLLVKRIDFRAALGVLQRDGWHLDPFRDPEAHLVFQHAVRLRRGPAEVDLHWTAAWGMFDAEGEREFWRAARRVTFRGEQALVLAAPDQMLQMFVHATLANGPIPPIRWVADAVLIRRAAATFDWDRLVRMAALRRQSLAAMRCVEYLATGLGVEVPGGVLRDLRHHVRLGEWPRLALRSSLGIGHRLHTLLMWMETARLDGLRHTPHRLAMMARLIRSRVGAPQDASSRVVGEPRRA